MMTVEKREKALFYIAMMVIVIAVFLNFAVIPVVEKINGLGNKIAVLEKDSQRYRRLIGNKESLRAAYDGLPAIPGGFDFSAKPDTSSFLKNLEAISRQSGLRLIEIRPLEGLSVKNSHLRVELRQQGSMLGIITFLYDVEGLAGFTIEKAQINPGISADSLESGLLIRAD